MSGAADLCSQRGVHPGNQLENLTQMDLLRATQAVQRQSLAEGLPGAELRHLQFQAQVHEVTVGCAQVSAGVGMEQAVLTGLTEPHKGAGSRFAGRQSLQAGQIDNQGQPLGLEVQRVARPGTNTLAEAQRRTVTGGQAGEVRQKERMLPGTQTDVARFADIQT